MFVARLCALLRRRFRAARHGDGGFTVLEVVVSLAIFVTFSTAATMAVANAIKANGDTRNRVAASNIAQSDLEQARAVPTPADATYSTSAPGDSSRYTVRRAVTMPSPSGSDACPAGSLITISVTVSSPGGHGVTIKTVVAC